MKTKPIKNNKSKKIMLCTFIFFGIFVFIQNAFAAAYYTVGQGGDYLTLAAALADPNIGDGANESQRDYITILNGTYASPRINIGSTKRFITIQAQTQDGVSINLSEAYLFNVTSTNYITISGLKCQGGAGFGYFFFCDHIILDHVEYSGGTDYGVRFGGDAAFSAGAGGHSNSILNCRFTNNGSLPDGGHHGILISNTSAASWLQKTVVSGCKLNGNGEDGIQVNGATDNSHADENHIAAYIEIKNCEMNNNVENGIDLKASRYLKVHHNVVSDNKDPGVVIHSPENTGAEGNTGTFKCVIYNNIITNNGGHGIVTGDGDYTQGSYNLIFNNLITANKSAGIFGASGKHVEGDEVFCNTILNTIGDDTTSDYYGGWGISYADPNEVIANIVFANANPGFRSNQNFTKINNLIDQDGKNWANNFYTTDPCFTDAAKSDYHLNENSSANASAYEGQILTFEQIAAYNNLLGGDLPLNQYGPTIYLDDCFRNGKLVIGALGVTRSGDVNSDGKVDVTDIQACVNHFLGAQDYGAKADVNQDGKVDVMDVQMIVNIVLAG